MSFGIGLIAIGVLSIIIGQMPERWGPAFQGAGRRTAQTLGGALLIVAGIVVLLVS